MKAVVQKNQIGDLFPWSMLLTCTSVLCLALGRSTQPFPAESPVGPVQVHKWYSSGHLHFFAQLIKQPTPPKKLCALPCTWLFQAALSPHNVPPKNLLCSLLDTIPLAPNHCSPAEKTISWHARAATAQSHPYSTCRRAIRGKSLSRCGVCNCLLLPGGQGRVSSENLRGVPGKAECAKWTGKRQKSKVRL